MRRHTQTYTCFGKELHQPGWFSELYTLVCVCVRVRLFSMLPKEAKKRGTWLSSQGVDSTDVNLSSFCKKNTESQKETIPKDEPRM